MKQDLKTKRIRKSNAERVKDWRKKHPDKQKEISQAYWLQIKKDPERHKKMKEYWKQYYSNHRDKRIKSVQEFWKRNPEKRSHYQLCSNVKNKKRMLKLRFSIFIRDNFTCQYCGKASPGVELEIDHKIPIAASNKKRNYNDISINADDYITACKECNIGKRDIILEMFKGK